MKIIREGILPENVIYEGTCPHCFAQIECNRGETQQHNLGDRYSGAFITYSARCPTVGCNHSIALREKTETPDDGVKLPLVERFHKLAGKTKP